MGTFYDTVLKMRKNGRPLKVEKPIAPVKPKTEVKKPKETAVKKNDRGTGKKS